MKCESKIKHSLYSKKKSILVVFLALMGVGLLPGVVQAQMFSVDDDRPDYDVPLSEFYIGWEPAEVTYKGDAGGVRAGAFAFEGPLLRLGYRGGILDLSMRTGGQITGLDDIGYFDFGGHADVDIPVFRSRPFALLLPVRVDSRFTNITNNMRFDRFRFGSLTLGAGAKVRARYLPTFRLEAGVVPSYGFSFASGGIFGGSMGSVAAHGRLYLDRLFGDTGLSLGYKYSLRNYDVDEEIYDYQINSHSIQMGITF